MMLPVPVVPVTIKEEFSVEEVSPAGVAIIVSPAEKTVEPV